MYLFRNNLLKNKYFSKNALRYFSSNDRNYQEVSIKVPWGHVSGKWWEPYDIRPILTLHGWQDNCGSFDRLIPLLNKDVGFLAIDFPGHGYSSRIPVGMDYAASIFQHTIRSVVSYFNWHTVSLLGHSFGGINSFIFAMLYPEEIDFILCLDVIKPTAPVSRRVDMAKKFQIFFKTNEFIMGKKEPPSYTLEEIKQKMCIPNFNSILPKVACYLMERNIAPSKLHSGKYYFTRDPRLKAVEQMHFCQDEIVENAKHMMFPIFCIKFRDAFYFEHKENFYQITDIFKRVSKDFDFNYTNGTHHGHLNNPENIAGLLTNFITRNNIGDRSIGGIKEDVIVQKPEIKLAELRKTKS